MGNTSDSVMPLSSDMVGWAAFALLGTGVAGYLMRGRKQP
jgi:hypothetical protein